MDGVGTLTEASAPSPTASAPPPILSQVCQAHGRLSSLLWRRPGGSRGHRQDGVHQGAVGTGARPFRGRSKAVPRPFSFFSFVLLAEGPLGGV